jgi:hypothetical protein
MARRHVEFFVNVLVGCLLVAATTNAVAGALLLWVHLAWRPVENAIYILANDPWRTRGRVMAAFYVAAGCWLASAGALFELLVIFRSLEVYFGVQVNRDSIQYGVYSMFGGLAGCSVIGLFACLYAAIDPVRVWFQPRFRPDFETPSARPEQSAAGPRYVPFNYAIFVIGTALMFPIVVACAFVLAELTKDVPADQATPNNLWWEFPLIFGPPVAAIVIYAWLSSRIVAQTPEDCWGARAADGETKSL